MQSLPLDVIGEIIGRLSNWEFVRYLMALSKSDRIELANYRHQVQFPNDDITFNSLTQYIQHVTTYHLVIVPGSQHLKSASWCYRRAALLGDMPALLAFVDRISISSNEYDVRTNEITPFHGVVWAARIGSWEVVQHIIEKITSHEYQHNALYQGSLQALRAGHNELALNMIIDMLKIPIDNFYLYLRIIAELTIAGIGPGLAPIYDQLAVRLEGYINGDDTDLGLDDLIGAANKVVQSLNGIHVNIIVDDDYADHIASFVFPMYGRADLWLRYMESYSYDNRRMYYIAFRLALHYNQLDFIRDLMDHMPGLREFLIEFIWIGFPDLDITDYESEIVSPSAVIFLRDMGLAPDKVLSHAIRMGDVKLIDSLGIDPFRLPDQEWHPAPIAYYFGHKDLASYYVNLLGPPSKEKVIISIGLYATISDIIANDIQHILQSMSVILSS